MLSFLPNSYKKLIVHEYWLRFGTAFFLALAILAIIAAAFLVPYVMFIDAQEKVASSRLATLAQSSQVSKAQTFRADLGTLHDEALRLMPEKGVMPDEVVTQIESLVTAGVSLSSLTYVHTSDGGAAITLGGIASTRQALQAFVASLQQASNLSDVVVPVSDFAQDTNINFTLTLTALYENTH